ncbi:hypothetical protein SYK_33450 [Pseudodesulfovibrio nedwellii]|uniref:Tetratricopeptide repeat protein n=1 Tax=Pseudodesulfovibrio nedwellii TaxID=2973072 RepID=A0ABM8B551_9BACT|nr:hypothetical protein [Pseudodesulfovibrio nedwellii]BDQ38985.1 hypothetical protein SYK_33450 [Pseudodesulfovibrio nedwellii]
MRYLFYIALLALLCSCNTSVGVGMHTGTSRIGVGAGGGRTGVGVGAQTGAGVSFTSYKDFLPNGPSDIYASNKKAVIAMNDGDYNAASQTFEANLQTYPNHPDATYYLGLTRIYQGKREEGFTLLKSYRDPDNYRMTSEVQRSAAYLEEKPELTAQKIHEVMNKNRSDGYQREIRERMDLRPSRW